MVTAFVDVGAVVPPVGVGVPPVVPGVVPAIELESPPPPHPAATTSMAIVSFRNTFISTAPELAEVL
jgi:hypothetical protein